MDEIGQIQHARPAVAPPTAAALHAGRARLVVATRPPARGHRSRRRPHGRLAAAHATAQWLRWPAAAAAGAAALAAAALVTAVIGGAPSGAPRKLGAVVTVAWTVQIGQDHTVTITVRQLRDPAGLQRELRHEGIPAIVRYIPVVTQRVGGHDVTGPACDYQLPWTVFPPSASQAVTVSAPGGSSIASPAHQTPSPSASPVPQPTPSASPVPRPTPSASPAADHLTDGTALTVITVRPRLLPKGAAILIDTSIAERGTASADLGVSLLASAHLPRCVPLSEQLSHHT